MNQDADDFNREMEEDILDDEQLNDMIKDDMTNPEPPKLPAKKQNVYQEQYRRAPARRARQEDFVEEPRVQQVVQVQPVVAAPVQAPKSSYGLDKLKNIVSVNKIKLPIFVTVLFIVLSLPQVNNLLGNYIALLKPNEDNSPNYIALVVKGVLFGLIVLVMSQLL
jgi:hypothetical protein